MSDTSGPTRRSLVLVVGSGRSGTSLFSELLHRLGYHVPEPQVEADPSNPRGFAESRWVVDFHTGLLKKARVQTADARPDAWAETATVVGDDAEDQARSFLRKQFRASEHVLIKDPRLAWFLPLWRRVADELGVTPRFVTMLRHPAAVLESKGRFYGDWQGDISRAAGWLNVMLYTERATREGLRAFVRYDDLLADWTRVVAGVGAELSLEPVSSASPGMIRAADEFVDPALSRSTPAWADVELPDDLRGLADNVWTLLGRLADKEAPAGDDVLTELDATRESYVALYRRAEAVAQSSVVAAVRSGQSRTSSRLEAFATRRIPNRHLRRIPPRWRRAILSLLGQRGR